MVAFGFRNLERDVTTIEIVGHAAAVRIGLGLVTSVVTNAAGEGVAHESFEGGFFVPVANPFVVGCGEERGSGVANHDVGVVAAGGTTGNHSAIFVDVDHGVRKVVHELGPGHGPKDVEGPLRSPEGIEVVVGALALADEGFGPGVVGVFMIDVADDAATEEGVPEVGVEFGLLSIGAAFDLDAPKPAVPIAIGVLHGLVEVPVREFGFEVADGSANTSVGEGDLHQEGLGEWATLDDDFTLAPITEASDGLVECGDEVDLEGLFAASSRPHGEAAVESFAIAGDARGVGDHLVVHELAAEVEDDAGVALFGVGVAVEADAGSGGELGSDVVVLEDDFVVTGFDDFVIVRELGGIVVEVALLGERHDGESGDLPTVDVAEAFDLLVVVAVARFPSLVGLGIGAEVDHAEGATSRAEVEEAGIDGVDLGFDPIDGVLFFRLGEASGEDGKEKDGEVVFHVLLGKLIESVGIGPDGHGIAGAEAGDAHSGAWQGVVV